MPSSSPKERSFATNFEAPTSSQNFQNGTINIFSKQQSQPTAKTKKDLAKAAEWYRSSADLGFALSQHSLAAMYEEGKGVKKDTVKATEWFKKAADQGSPPSQTAYAAKLERGDGVTKSTAKAALWYLKAAQKDFVPAMTRDAY